MLNLLVWRCRSGDGGAGEIVEAGRGKYVKNNKYHPGSNQPKHIWLPASEQGSTAAAAAAAGWGLV
jgi:hypothetical protein